MHKIFITAFVLLLSGCANIDRGLYSLSDAVAPVDRVTGQRSLNITARAAQIKQSDEEGDKLIRRYVAAGKPVNEKINAAEYARLTRIFSRIHAVSHMSNEKWTAHFLPDSDWNAFTMGGTYIFVFKGMMDALKSDDELAAVIGHEIAHVAANHVYEQQSYTMAARLRGSRGAEKSGFQAAFTLKNEEEADKVGTLYATLAGYDPYAASRLWKRMYEHGGDYSARLIDHPVNSERYKKTEALARLYEPYYMAGKINPNHAEILRTNKVFGSGARQERQPGQGGGLMSVLETAGNIFNQRQQAKTEEMNQRANLQFIQYVTQSLVLTGRALVDSRTLRVSFAYKGAYPVRNLNLLAVVGNERANDRPLEIMPPNSTGVAEFRFEKVDLSRVNINSIPIAVGHAER